MPESRQQQHNQTVIGLNIAFPLIYIDFIAIHETMAARALRPSAVVHKLINMIAILEIESKGKIYWRRAKGGGRRAEGGG
ncbi:MAG: hypothetical protein KDH97_14445 [Calditrichaeota bacterium]|nr:hypothetical protein [Calditrichota bacterium]MCB0298332.1 hypothetical protein [Calditrichota bacterium]MCB0304075.1 hypothetical protein [Calditrichota bacterium]